MKKRVFAVFITVIITIVFAFSLVACVSGGNDSERPGNDSLNPDNGDSTKASKVLVVYFSATNNTKRVAEYIKEATNGTLFELSPVKPYTSEDLNWNDSSSRVCKEHNDETLRDVELVSVSVENWSEYNVVFIGYPVWWGIAAWPVNGFVKSNDFSGKTVIPFATSASSGMGQSGSLLAAAAGTGNWLDGRRFSSNASESTVKNWVNQLDI